MKALDERFSDALHTCARSWRLLVDRRLKDLGLSQAAWMTVAMVAKAKTPLSQSELALSVGVEGATMVAMLDRLARGGLIERQASEQDRRIKRVVLTAAGQDLYEQVRVQALAVRREMLAGLDTAQMRAAAELLETVQARLDEAA